MLLPEHYTVSQKNSPLMSYCKREYKNDWEKVYYELHKSSKNGFLEKIINKFSSLFEKKYLEVTGGASQSSVCSLGSLPSSEPEKMLIKSDHLPENDKVAA